MTSQKSLALLSLVGAIPCGVLAAFGVMAGISGASGTLQILYFVAAGLGAIVAFLPITALLGIFPKAGGKTKKADAKAAVAAPEDKKKGKADKKAAAVEEEEGFGEVDELTDASDDGDLLDSSADESFEEMSDEFQFDDEIEEEPEPPRKKRK